MKMRGGGNEATERFTVMIDSLFALYDFDSNSCVNSWLYVVRCGCGRGYPHTLSVFRVSRCSLGDMGAPYSSF